MATRWRKWCPMAEKLSHHGQSRQAIQIQKKNKNGRPSIWLCQTCKTYLTEEMMKNERKE